MKHLEVAVLEIGNEEVPRGSNWGDHIQKYLHSVGIDFPAAWCMAFVYWCCEQSGAKYPDILADDFLMQRLREIGLLK